MFGNPNSGPETPGACEDCEFNVLQPYCDFCKYYAMFGLCPWSSWARKNCPKSCKTCTTGNSSGTSLLSIRLILLVRRLNDNKVHINILLCLFVAATPQPFNPENDGFEGVPPGLFELVDAEFNPNDIFPGVSGTLHQTRSTYSVLTKP